SLPYPSPSPSPLPLSPKRERGKDLSPLPLSPKRERGYFWSPLPAGERGRGEGDGLGGRFLLSKAREPFTVPQAWKRIGNVGVLGEHGLIKLQTQAGPVRQDQLAVANRVPAADELVSPGHVKFGKSLLDHEIGRTGIQVQASGQGDGADRAMRGD